MKSSQLHADTEASPLWDRIRKLDWDNNIAAARITDLENLARKIASLDISFLGCADLAPYRPTIIELRNQAQELMQ